ncbi:MAG TPA: DegV family protein [candidate division Zixibacteria bacterium]|nr:DegV family protein [candidate division Zixibacteria bacterium]
MSIRIITDSSSDISYDFADENNIKVIPLSVSFEDKSYKEDRTFDIDKHYDYYESNKNFFPKTSQPSPKEYYQVYNELIKDGAKDIIVICISSALSGTLNSARLASEMIKNEGKEVNIHLVDSLNASYSEVFLVKDALTQIKNGKNAETIIKRLNLLVTKIKTFIVIPTLKYLHLGGRISIAKYLLARLLRKIVITQVNEKGANETASTVKSFEQGLEKLVELTTEKNKRFPRKVAIVHARNYEMAEKLKKIVREKIPNAEIEIVRTKVTISAHTGPKAVALISDFGEELK